MSRDDIQKLLGGYATGTLTPDEQRALYEAALTDQELFDALAREEALREVLSDPASRAQLLAAIDDVPEAWYRRWWRPMVVMGTAALLIVALAIYTRPPQGTQLAKVELPKFRPPSAAPAVPLLPPPPELRQAQPKLKELRIPLPPPKAVPPPPLPVIAAAPAPPPVTLDGLAPRFDVGANAPRAQAPAVGARLLPQSTVELSGRVTDASGATVPAAQVEVKSLATGEKVKTSTDAKGDFTAPAASGDKVEISASAPGLQSSTAGLVTPRAGAPAPAPVNLTLAAGSAVEMADVTAATEVLPSGVAAGSGGRGWRRRIRSDEEGRDRAPAAAGIPAPAKVGGPRQSGGACQRRVAG
ncbi:MAG: carboxypeptidase-like regulatory domain-containing protein [Ignavibacteriota bacterium]